MTLLTSRSVTRETTALLADPYSQSSTGRVGITAIHTVDILVRHAASFCKIVGGYSGRGRRTSAVYGRG